MCIRDRCNKESKKKTRKNKREYFEAIAKEGSRGGSEKGPTREFFKIIKELSGKYNRGSSIITDKNGKKLL